MTITRAAFAAIAEFVARLPEYVPGPETRKRGDGRLEALWVASGWCDYVMHVALDGSIETDADALLRHLSDHYRPKPRSYAVLVHEPHGLASLEAARGTSVFLDTPENRAYCAKEGETWLTFDLVERE